VSERHGRHGDGFCVYSCSFGPPIKPFVFAVSSVHLTDDLFRNEHYLSDEEAKRKTYRLPVCGVLNGFDGDDELRTERTSSSFSAPKTTNVKTRTAAM
jgi:hypothetical protein